MNNLFNLFFSPKKWERPSVFEKFETDNIWVVPNDYYHQNAAKILHLTLLSFFNLCMIKVLHRSSKSDLSKNWTIVTEELNRHLSPPSWKLCHFLLLSWLLYIQGYICEYTYVPDPTEDCLECNHNMDVAPWKTLRGCDEPIVSTFYYTDTWLIGYESYSLSDTITRNRLI